MSENLEWLNDSEKRRKLLAMLIANGEDAERAFVRECLNNADQAFRYREIATDDGSNPFAVALKKPGIPVEFYFRGQVAAAGKLTAIAKVVLDSEVSTWEDCFGFSLAGSSKEPEESKTKRRRKSESSIDSIQFQVEGLKSNGAIVNPRPVEDPANFPTAESHVGVQNENRLNFDSAAIPILNDSKAEALLRVPHADTPKFNKCDRDSNDAKNRPRNRLPEALFKDIVNACTPRLRAYLLRSGLPESDCDDVLQEVFVRLWEAAFADDYIAEMIADVSSSIRYLIRIAENLLIDLNRYNNRIKRNLKRTRSFGELQEASLPADSSEPVEILISDENEVLLRKLLMQLTEAQRTVVCLRFDKGMEIREIAGMMGKRPNAVSQLFVRAIANLQQLMAYEISQDRSSEMAERS